MLIPKSAHKHKMEEAEPKAVMLVDAQGAAIGKWDIFYRKQCSCGFSETYKHERTDKRPKLRGGGE